jgi:hypothetical protein
MFNAHHATVLVKPKALRLTSALAFATYGSARNRSMVSCTILCLVVGDTYSEFRLLCTPMTPLQLAEPHRHLHASYRHKHSQMSAKGTRP